jgi:hypothetical protein
MHRRVGDVATFERDRSGVGPKQPDRHFERRRFARAVRPQEADDFAAIDAKRNAANDGAAAERFDEPLGL